jgi:hypothetical protein
VRILRDVVIIRWRISTRRVVVVGVEADVAVIIIAPAIIFRAAVIVVTVVVAEAVT